MDNSVVQNLIGKKVIGFKHDYVDEKGKGGLTWLIETIEAIGPNWVVTKGRIPALTWVWVDNIIQGLQKEVVEEGEPGQPVSQSQLHALFRRMVKSLAVDGVTIERLERAHQSGLFDKLDAHRRLCLHYNSGGKPTD